MASRDPITIGELSARSGVATSALRYYESLGLITSHRTEGNQRRYARAEVRRVSVIRAAQRLGLSLDEVAAALADLPESGTPTAHDWEALSSHWRLLLERRIAALQRLRDDLSSCIGCGCLSLTTCALFNFEDGAARDGSGPRYLLEPDAERHLPPASED